MEYFSPKGAGKIFGLLRAYLYITMKIFYDQGEITMFWTSLACDQWICFWLTGVSFLNFSRWAGSRSHQTWLPRLSIHLKSAQIVIAAVSQVRKCPFYWNKPMYIQIVVRSSVFIPTHQLCHIAIVCVMWWFLNERWLFLHLVCVCGGGGQRGAGAPLLQPCRKTYW